MAAVAVAAELMALPKGAGCILPRSVVYSSASGAVAHAAATASGVREDAMVKVLNCGDIMPGCDWSAKAESEEKLLKRAADHAREAHDLKITPEVAAKVRAAIHEE